MQYQPPRITLLSCFLVLFFISSREQEVTHPVGRPGQITLAGELKTLYNLSDLPAFREHSVVAQTSSFDTTGGNDDGFSGKYSFIRKNADGTLVILDLKGAGLINRIWTPTPTEDTLDFYIDDQSRPAFSIRFIDLFSGKQYPFLKPLCGNQLGGYYCYLPIPFQESCRIVCRGKKIQFHQIQYRLFTGSIRVKKFSLPLDPEETEGLEQVARLWNKPSHSIEDFGTWKSGQDPVAVSQLYLKPGEQKTIFRTEKPGRITGIEFERDPFVEWNPQVDLKITWDHESMPATYCPLTDFFGYAFGRASMQSLLLGSRENKDYCYFPMPFDQMASIELIYRKGPPELRPIRTRVKIYYSFQKREPAKEGKFYSNWNSHLWPAGQGPHVFLSATGKGHYVASLLQARGLASGMTYFFEGDDSTAVDGLPRIHGTGSEDYFNGGWYALMDRWDSKMSLPIHGSLDYSLPFCRTGGYRLYLSDKISFERSIFQSMEHGPSGNSIPSAYTSLAMYYCSDPVRAYLKPVNELTQVHIPDTLMIYPQLMDFSLEGDAETNSLWAFNTGGESFLFTISRETWIRIKLGEIPSGHYRVAVDLAKLPDGCEFSLFQRQTQVSEWISTQNPEKSRIEYLYLGDVDLNNQSSTLSLRLRPKGSGKQFFFNRLILVRK